MEREIKISLPRADSAERERSVTTFSVVRERLVALGGQQSAAPHWEVNWLFDRREELQQDGKLLRIRERRSSAGERVGAVLTVKAVPQNGEASKNGGAKLDATARGVKERIEREVAIASAADAVATLSLLGFQPTRRYDKVREAWLLVADSGEHEVVLDHTPIGDFLEIEGPSPHAVAQALNLEAFEPELRSYLGIFDQRRAAQGPAAAADPGTDMLFSTGAPAGFSAPTEAAG